MPWRRGGQLAVPNEQRTDKMIDRQDESILDENTYLTDSVIGDCESRQRNPSREQMRQIKREKEREKATNAPNQTE